MPRTQVFVEGTSDAAALVTLAERSGRDLHGEGVSIVVMGGASSFDSYLAKALGGPDLRLAGLCDEREERDFRRGLERNGLGANLSRNQMEELGFFVCVRDLEDELIRAVGPDRVQVVMEAAGDLRSFRSLQNQPHWRNGDIVEQMRRYFGAGAGRKERYARLLASAVDMERAPRPLQALLHQL